MTAPVGFWSYVHDDDDAEGGRIIRLAHDIVSRYEMITAEKIELFVDRDSIEWGEVWRSRVDEALASVAFFIPVITPRFFQSVECRRELTFFAQRATALGVRELVMPILYTDFAALHAEPVEDDAMTLVKSFNWEDWTDLCFEEPGSGLYRRGVARLADRLAAANSAAEAAQPVDLDVDVLSAPEGDDDEPGLIDRMAEAEVALPEWSETLMSIGAELEEVGRITTEGNALIEKADKQGKGFAARLTAAKIIARDLSGPAERIREYGQTFTTQLNSVDSGVRAMIELAPAEAEANDENREKICEFFSSILGMAQASEGGLGAIVTMVDSMSPLERLSRDLRPPLREMRAGLTVMAEGREVIRDWVRAIEDSGVECP